MIIDKRYFCTKFVPVIEHDKFGLILNINNLGIFDWNRFLTKRNILFSIYIMKV